MIWPGPARAYTYAFWRIALSAPSSAALDAISVFIRSFLPRAQVIPVADEQLRVTDGAEEILLPFNRDQLDDFGAVLEGGQPVRYSRGIKNDLHYRVYVALGLEGMIPDVKMFEVLINEEERDWLGSCRLSETRFSEETAKALYEGLVELRTSLRLTLQSGVEVPEVKAELVIVESLTNCYETHETLDSTEVTLGSLTYLKAAALCWIARLELAKAAVAGRRTKVAFDQKIFGIVQQFWVAAPYNRIKLPPAVQDWLEQRNHSTSMPKPAHQSHIDIGMVLEKLDVRLKDRWRGAWVALESDNPDRVSQATNSMVEVLDQVIDRVRGSKEFKSYLAGRFPQQAEVVLATRTWISKVKDGLQGIKHNTKEQPPEAAQDLMHQAEWIVNLLLRG
jgi:hypothetical protein